MSKIYTPILTQELRKRRGEEGAFEGNDVTRCGGGRWHH